MNVELFLAKRLYGTRKGGRRISRPAVAIAQWGVAVGTLVMFVSICIITGFKQQIRDKITDVEDASVDQDRHHQGKLLNPVDHIHAAGKKGKDG